jgi:monoamine oxidase
LKKIFINRIERRQFLKTSLSGFALATLPGISFAQSNPDVVVIGAGSAGLSAMAELKRRGITAVCIEGMNRIGGRCYTDNSIFGVPADIGAHWLHGFTKNKIAEFGKKHKDKFKVYKEKGSRSFVYDGKRKVDGDELWKIYEQIKEIKYTRSSDVPMIDLIPEKIKRNSWFDTVHKMVDDGRDLSNFTLGDDNGNWSDPGSGDGLCREGYGALLAYYRKDIPVKLNTIVNEIKWGGKGVQVVTNKGTINAKACIVTVSVGVLKAGKIKFTPSLPPKKYEAFEGISMGFSNRVLMQLKKKFMGKFKDDSYLYTKCKSNGAKSPETFYGLLKMSGSNVSLFGMSGQFSKDLENQGSEAMIDFVINDLKSTFGSKFYKKYFIKAYASGWSNNPFTFGAYSGAMPGKARLRPELKKQVGNRVFFAGEATANAFATVHGADRSGKRAAVDLYTSPALKS